MRLAESRGLALWSLVVSLELKGLNWCFMNYGNSIVEVFRLDMVNRLESSTLSVSCRLLEHGCLFKHLVPPTFLFLSLFQLLITNSCHMVYHVVHM